MCIEGLWKRSVCFCSDCQPLISLPVRLFLIVLHQVAIFGFIQQQCLLMSWWFNEKGALLNFCLWLSFVPTGWQIMEQKYHLGIVCHYQEQTVINETWNERQACRIWKDFQGSWLLNLFETSKHLCSLSVLFLWMSVLSGWKNLQRQSAPNICVVHLCLGEGGGAVFPWDVFIPNKLLLWNIIPKLVMWSSILIQNSIMPD